ncbi:hypothetical protein HanXRQr2_Chr05g0236591 [Helianthus annuus]|uniref:Uncharacterized protein n=1 Tax=Helianthus annuus TaxID=4232 RepID=A0A9K3NQG0_HELAN|nr:hypothetical protein HanXRQr2_Chr05g0236591 [Helianthus annuus]KAJ0586165.1 hypothetical protein HanHA89_Chr05g0208821 [Helianthus annuus]KAJ0924435.1 hypothetical protein HanPSC8_Chr05g0228151 [Helianthus annuus]
MNSAKLVSGTYSMDESVVEMSYWALLGVMASSATFNHVFQERGISHPRLFFFSHQSSPPPSDYRRNPLRSTRRFTQPPPSLGFR